MAGHTKGPWTVEPTEFANESVAYDVKADDGAVLIACPPTKADADLIAAAPDMLAALEYIVAWNPADWSAETARDMARTAIAKAKGAA